MKTLFVFLMLGVLLVVAAGSAQAKKPVDPCVTDPSYCGDTPGPFPYPTP